jgi:hypothetical protein
MLRRNASVLACALFLLTICGGSLFSRANVQIRFLLYPLTVLGMLAVMLRPTWRRAFAFGTVLFWQVLLTPESTYLLPALAIPIFSYEFPRRDFTRTWRVGLVGIGWGAALVAFLSWHHAFGAFLEYYRIFADGHRFTGGIPFNPGNETYTIMAYLPTLAIFCFFWRLALHVHRGRSWSPLDWTMVGVSLFVLLYYQKFVSRADLHVAQPHTVAMPLYFYLLIRLLKRADRWARKHVSYTLRPVSLLLALGYVAASPAHLLRDISDIGTKWQPLSPPQEKVSEETLFVASPEFNATLKDYREFFARYLRADEKIFDFTNQPQFFFYYLGRQPATRYFHISMAIAPLAQRNLISELEREKPRLVIYQATRGLGAWDGVTSMVRHYDVSRYLLTHYRPFKELRGNLLMVRNDTDWASEGKVSRTGYEQCNWGTVPYFWRESAAAKTDGGLPFTTRSEGGAFVTEIAVPNGTFGKPRLELELDRMDDDFVVLTDRPEGFENARAQIAFRGTKHDERAVYPIEVGSCYQWYRFEGEKIYLRSGKQLAIRSIRIVD